MANNLKIVLMTPARSGSQRLKLKNLRQFNGRPLILHNLFKAQALKIFDEIYVNTESEKIGNICISEGFSFYKRNPKLADNKTTSEDFVYDFLKQIECDYLIQLHSIAPLIKAQEIKNFTEHLINNQIDTLLSCQEIILESIYLGKPVNFDFKQKSNSQDLNPIKTISWAITGWKRKTYIEYYEAGKCATYSGKIDYYMLSKNSNLAIKTEEDFLLAEQIFKAIDY